MRVGKMLVSIVATGTMVFALAACGDDDETGAAGDTTTTSGTPAMTLQFTEQNGSGVTGTADLSEESGETMVKLSLQNAPGPHPAHIHEGTCATLNPAPKYPLADVTDGSSETTVSVTMAALSAMPHAINVHESAANLPKYVACVDIPSSGGTGTTTTP